MEAQISLLLVVAAVHEIAEDVGVEDRRRSAGAEIRADLIPGIGRPVLRTGVLDHLHPHFVECLGFGRVHRRLELAAADSEVPLSVVRIAGQEAGMDRRPRA